MALRGHAYAISLAISSLATQLRLSTTHLSIPNHSFYNTMADLPPYTETSLDVIDEVRSLLSSWPKMLQVQGGGRRCYA